MKRFEREGREAFKNLHDFAMKQTIVKPERLVVAGGAVADFTKASDIDLWVLADDRGGMAPDDTVDELAAAIDPLWTARDSTLGPHIRVVQAHAATRFYRPVQILTAREKELYALLDRFDISTHMVGYDLRDREVVYGPRFTTLVDMARVHNDDYPEHALSRLIKIEARYNLPPNTAAKVRLRRLISEKETDGSTEDYTPPEFTPKPVAFKRTYSSAYSY